MLVFQRNFWDQASDGLYLKKHDSGLSRFSQYSHDKNSKKKKIHTFFLKYNFIFSVEDIFLFLNTTIKFLFLFYFHQILSLMNVKKKTRNKQIKEKDITITISYFSVRNTGFSVNK